MPGDEHARRHILLDATAPPPTLRDRMIASHAVAAMPFSAFFYAMTFSRFARHVSSDAERHADAIIAAFRRFRHAAAAFRRWLPRCLLRSLSPPLIIFSLPDRRAAGFLPIAPFRYFHADSFSMILRHFFHAMPLFAIFIFRRRLSRLSLRRAPACLFLRG